MAWMPKSPKASSVPPLAAPVRLGWCCLRCLTLRGINMVLRPPQWVSVVSCWVSCWVSSRCRAGCRRVGCRGGWRLRRGRRGSRRSRALGGCVRLTGARGPRRTVGTGAAGRPLAAARGTTAPGGAGPGGSLGLSLGAGAGDLALVDPDLHADAAEGGLGLVEAVVDVRPEGVQGHAPLTVELGARHLGATEATGALDAHTLGAAAHRGLHRLAHGTAERHPARELLGHALRDELRVDLGVLDLEDVELDLLAGELLELAADPVGLGAATADHDARACGVDVHADPVAGALDLDAGRCRHAPCPWTAAGGSRHPRRRTPCTACRRTNGSCGRWRSRGGNRSG